MTDPMNGEKPHQGAPGKRRPRNRRKKRRQQGAGNPQSAAPAHTNEQAPSNRQNFAHHTRHEKRAVGESNLESNIGSNRQKNDFEQDGLNLSAPNQRPATGSATGHVTGPAPTPVTGSSAQCTDQLADQHAGAGSPTAGSSAATSATEQPRLGHNNQYGRGYKSYNKPNHKPPYKRPYGHYKKPQGPLYGALDLGTNNCRLLIARPLNRGRFRVVDAYSRIVRLGEGMTVSGRINERAMDRAVEALKACRKKLEFREVTRHRLIATQACRMADNCEHFLSRVRDEAGIELEIVDQKTEARLAVSGCGSLVDRESDGVVVFDIGGGSSELALLDTKNFRARKIAQHITAWTSLPLGVVTLSERYGGHEITPKVFQSMIDEVAEHLSQFKERFALSNAQKSGKFHLLGTSGTVTTLAGVHLNLPRYDRRMVDGIWLDDRQIDSMVQRIMDMGFEGRVKNPCIGGERADLVLAGCAILQAIRAVWPADRLRVADRGLREGILTELMYQDGVWRRRHHSNKPATG